MFSLRSSLLLALGALACARPAPAPKTPEPAGRDRDDRPTVEPAPRERPPVAVRPQPDTLPKPEEPSRDPESGGKAPAAPPAEAFAREWMPLRSTGVVAFRQAHAEYDGRGVLIGILDSGIDAGIPGLGTTSTGDRKLLDLRDFSGEGRVPLRPATLRGDTVLVETIRLAGAERIRGIATAGDVFGGTLREMPLGEPPASDVNGNGTVGDTLAVVVVRASDGWVLFADTDGDGSLGNERPVRDYLVARETFGWGRRGAATPLTVAANFGGDGAPPRLDLFFDNSGHGTHVAGIAAANDMYGVAGFDGVAPGAQLLGLKISNNAHGGISTTGSMIRAIDYAIRFAAARRVPLVLNMSFGVGNEREGHAVIDRMIDSVLARHPELVFTISAGNDGPGLSTVGFPGSARRSITVGATMPGVFLPPAAGGSTPGDQIAYFSSRGGELPKPDIVTPGMAYSTVPRWDRGGEINQGTSMASPHAAGLAALLVSGLVAEGRPVDAAAIRQALMVTAQPLPGGTFLDEGAGLPDVGRAHAWLGAGRRVPQVTVRAVGTGDELLAAFRPNGLASPGDTLQVFELSRSGGGPATFRLRSSTAWLSTPASVRLDGGKARVTVRYDAAALGAPGVHTGVVTGWAEDTTLGPIFRLVNTVVVPAPAGGEALVSGERLVPGAVRRVFFDADSARPFEVRVATSSRFENALAFLHEPRGMPFREQSGAPAGFDQAAAVYRVDARDAVEGTYEVAAVAAPGRPATVTVRLNRSPLSLRAATTAGGVTATLTNPGGTPVRADVGVLLGGAERRQGVSARGSEVQRVPFRVPAWVRGVVVDVAMPREQWSRFTDFGVTLLDSAGAIIAKSPLNYAIGRLQAPLPEGHGEMPVELSLLPGFADPAGREEWSAQVTIRLYADTAIALPARDPAAAEGVTVSPGTSASVEFTAVASPFVAGDGFHPLGVLVARTDGIPWTREFGLVPATAAGAGSR